MALVFSPLSKVSRRTPLAACTASVFVLASRLAGAATSHPVTSCLDDGSPGTLRSVIADAATVSDDTVDLSGLACSKISLGTGGITTAIAVTQYSLNIVGPGADKLTIDAAALPTLGRSRIFTHYGQYTLALQDIRLVNGHVKTLPPGSYFSAGGCIYSAGSVQLTNVAVSGCRAGTPYTQAAGGAIFATHSVTLDHSTITDSIATSDNYHADGGAIFAQDVLASHSVVSGNTAVSLNQPVRGGGVFAGNVLTLAYSELSGNSAQASATWWSYGGGAWAFGAVLLKQATVSNNSALGKPMRTAGGGVFGVGSIEVRNSTISGNYSQGYAGGLSAIRNDPNANGLYMLSSTVSGNSAGNKVGGVFSNFASVQIYASTIAFNTAPIGRIGTGPFHYFAPGLALIASTNAITATLSSSLLSNNTYGTSELDLTTDTPSFAITFNSAPANNFVRAYVAPGLPADTKNAACPRLGRLRDNGGPTQTHALLSGSIAIDMGNNVKNQSWDQRGLMTDPMPAPYPRVSNGAADIGAYEVNQSDIVFGSDVEGCPSLN